MGRATQPGVVRAVAEVFAGAGARARLHHPRLRAGQRGAFRKNQRAPAIDGRAGKSAGAYTLKGKDSLWNQMTKAMKTRPAKAAIGVVNIDNVKQHKPWIENGRYQIVVAVNRENMDFTLLEIAFSLLRYRLIEDISTKDSATTEPKLDIARFEELIKEITSNKDTLRTMRSNLTKIGSIVDNQDSQVTNIEKAIKSQVRQLKMLLELEVESKE